MSARVVRRQGWSIATCTCGWQGRGHKTKTGGNSASHRDAYQHNTKHHGGQR